MGDRVVKVEGAAPRELRELAASVRRTIEAMLAIGDASEELVWAREKLDEVAARLERSHGTGPTPGAGGEAGPARERPFYINGPVNSGHNPIVPLIEMESEGGVTRGKVSFGVAHEGPPGFVHGGFVAWLFDQVLGHNNVAAGLPALTGSLTVRYRKPTPLFTELRFEARIESARGRWVRAKGKLWAGDALSASAEGLFAIPSPDGP
jgi:acyl-coenzyme A thioesterase PaaI-like protein